MAHIPCLVGVPSEKAALSLPRMVCSIRLLCSLTDANQKNPDSIMKLSQPFQSSLSPLAMGQRLGKSLLLGGLLLLSSCVQESFVAGDDDNSQPVEIELSGSVAPSSVDTRVVVDDDYVKDKKLPISIARVDQAVDGTWATYMTDAVVLNADRAKGEGATNVDFTQKQYYTMRSKNNKTRLLGWYPQVDGSLVTISGESPKQQLNFNISKGNMDVMLTEPVEADKTTPFGTSGKQLVFKHALTQITVKAYGDAAGATNWGVIQSIEVVDVPSLYNVGLFNGNKVFTGSSDIKLNHPGADTAMGNNISIPNGLANATTCGYAMFQPTATKTFQLKVTTSLGGAHTLTVSSPQATFAAGTSYEVVLNFVSTSIAPSAKIGVWVNGGDATGNMQV